MHLKIIDKMQNLGNAKSDLYTDLDWLLVEKIVSVSVDAYAVKVVKMKFNLKILSK